MKTEQSDLADSKNLLGCDSNRWCMNDIEKFETRFLRVSYYSGYHFLDRFLLSLMAIKDSKNCILEKVREDDFILIDKFRISEKIKGNSCVMADTFERLKKSSTFKYWKFCDENGIKPDSVGQFQLRFQNPRMVLHVLSLTNAIVLTMRMHKVADYKVPQRKLNNYFEASSENLMTNIFRFILIQLRRKRYSDKKENEIIKLFKTSLCRLVSVIFEQDELPEGDFIDLFPKCYWDQITKNLSKEALAAFVFSVLQSKQLCEEVPESFEKEALVKHRKQLMAEKTPLSPEILKTLQECGREFGQRMKKHKYYDPDKGNQPSGKATFEFPRNKGGVKGDLVYHDILCNDKQVRFDPEDRPEPYVILLCGQPGSGKSTRINQIISGLSSLFPGVPTKELVYQRTCNVEHWDGYNGQPITVMDDLGQSPKGDDILEFVTLVSTNPYVLPMAALEEKGMKFNSSVIICTTNLSFGGSLGGKDGSPVIEPNSFWRRFHFPIFTELSDTYKLKPGMVEFHNSEKRLFHPKIPSSTPNFRGASVKVYSSRDNSELWEPFDIFSWDFKPEIKRRWKVHNNMSTYWKQTILNGVNDHSNLRDWIYGHEHLPEEIETLGLNPKVSTHVNTYLKFPAFPPEHVLPVRVEPIREPLKVRTITAGIGQTFCLKPFQVAMWKTLNHYPQFALTHGSNRLETAIERIYEESDEGDFWISGDYTAATDSIPLEASLALMKGILESVDHLPTKRWVLKELSPHLMVYPERFGIEPVVQKSGQLMGSLLSFPLLCLINDCTARMAGLSPNKYLINGDDILMRGNPSIYPEWKSLVSTVGLELSLGKNYIHPRYGTVNSQLVIDNVVVDSGKQMILDRRPRVLAECVKELQIQMSSTPVKEVNDLFVSVNRKLLKQTIRGIGIPYSHGGLGFSWDDSYNSKRRDPNLYKLIYFHDLFEKIKPQKNCLSVPYFSKVGFSDTMLRLKEAQCLDPVELKEFHEDFLHISKLSHIQKRLRGNENLRKLLFSRDIQSYPPLPFVHTFQIPIKSAEKSKPLQDYIDKVFLQSLYDGCPYTYQDFRTQVLKGICNIKEPIPKDLVLSFTLYDFPVDCQVPEFDLNYKVIDFKKEKFEKKLKLSKAWVPKDLGINPNEFFDQDFSDDLTEDFRTAMGLFEIEFPNMATNTDLAREMKFDLKGFLNKDSKKDELPVCS